MRLRLHAAELCESLLLALVRLLLPAQGRHRAAPGRPPLSVTDPPPPPTRRFLATEPLVMDTPLVRPYLHPLEIHA
ncbi:hypothetical protein GCM10023086_39750 [Streptomyces venetus]|uniref:Secreted protein n=1 Tax=Streptomyces venetus TaxID=1701086 RepID=A0ABP8G462_9ACTN